MNAQDKAALATLTRGTLDTLLDRSVEHLRARLTLLDDLEEALTWAASVNGVGTGVRIDAPSVDLKSMRGRRAVVAACEDHDGTGPSIAAALVKLHKECGK